MNRYEILGRVVCYMALFLTLTLITGAVVSWVLSPTVTISMDVFPWVMWAVSDLGFLLAVTLYVRFSGE